MGQNVNLQFKKQNNRIFFLFLNQIYCFWFPPAWLVGNAVSVVTGASLLPLWRHEFRVVPGPGRREEEGGGRFQEAELGRPPSRPTDLLFLLLS